MGAQIAAGLWEIAVLICLGGCIFSLPKYADDILRAAQWLRSRREG